VVLVENVLVGRNYQISKLLKPLASNKLNSILQIFTFCFPQRITALGQGLVESGHAKRVRREPNRVLTNLLPLTHHLLILRLPRLAHRRQHAVPPLRRHGDIVLQRGVHHGVVVLNGEEVGEFRWNLRLARRLALKLQGHTLRFKIIPALVAPKLLATVDQDLEAGLQRVMTFERRHDARLRTRMFQLILKILELTHGELWKTRTLA